MNKIKLLVMVIIGLVLFPNYQSQGQIAENELWAEFSNLEVDISNQGYGYEVDYNYQYKINSLNSFEFSLDIQVDNKGNYLASDQKGDFNSIFLDDQFYFKLVDEWFLVTDLDKEIRLANNFQQNFQLNFDYQSAAFIYQQIYPVFNDFLGLDDQEALQAESEFLATLAANTNAQELYQLNKFEANGFVVYRIRLNKSYLMPILSSLNQDNKYSHLVTFEQIVNNYFSNYYFFEQKSGKYSHFLGVNRSDGLTTQSKVEARTATNLVEISMPEDYTEIGTFDELTQENDITLDEETQEAEIIIGEQESEIESNNKDQDSFNKMIDADFSQTKAVQSGDLVAEIITNKGTIMAKLFPEKAPLTVENFQALAEADYYDGLIFHRVIPEFIIQGGDPTGTGMAGESTWGGTFDNEIDPNLSNIRGALAMANAGVRDGQGTNGSQFYINLADNIFLDGYIQDEEFKDCSVLRTSCHPVFGQVYSGMEIVDQMSEVETDLSDKPVVDLIINEIKVYTLE
jgi:peptidyl-prolyl cis-trans isomerase B (cyclophilin B)